MGPAVIYSLLRRVLRNLPTKLSLQLKPLLLKLGHFAESLINGTRPVHSAEEGRDVLEVVLKAAESADGWQVCAAKTFQIKEEKPQEHHFAFCVSMVIVNLTKKTKNIRFI